MKLIKDKPLTSLSEIMYELLNGKTIFNNKTMILYKIIDDELMYNLHDIWERSSSSFNDLFYMESWYTTKPQEWYDNIPKRGILCKIKIDDMFLYYKVIKEYKNGNFLDNSDCAWDNAIPLTLDEVKELIYDPNT
jgi:hypothetical protein